ncbi:MAG: glycogen debranching enzyme family protein [Planctomycetes bacterium]|nr:glycogen debranching enzyme family protein [Planctomycetota bacterium]
MLTLQKGNNIWSPFRNKSKNGGPSAVSISTANQPIENLLTREWLLTNERGSYASSTIAGCNTRGYHGLLIGSLNPPVNRIMALANCLEMVIFERQTFKLSTFEFSDKFTPSGFIHLKQFRRDIAAHFDYELDKLKLTKSVYLLRDTDTVAVVYDFTSVHEPVEFVLRPFVGLRDFHTQQKSHAPLCSQKLGDGVLVRHNVPNSCELFLSCQSVHSVREKNEVSHMVNFEKDRQWWFNFLYRNNRERGQDFTEDLWTPGFFKCRIETPVKIILWANLSPPWARCKPEELANLDIDAVREDLHRHQESIKRKAKITQHNLKFQISNSKFQSKKFFEALCLTAESFIAKRQINSSCVVRDAYREKENTQYEYRTTILAGYPWFADWGRDAFIALPGLLLSTGRFEEAKSVLTTFAAAADEGMIPNRFDDRSGTTYFNSVDASLWFINAAFQYVAASGDSKTFMQELMPTIRWIIDSYHKGTRFDIRADSDGLITAGNNETQLTWMDAKYDGVAFTPRYGKAVEVNALWYNSLCLLAQFKKDRGQKTENRGQRTEILSSDLRLLSSEIDKVQRSFCELFWNESKGYLNDCILPDGSVDESLRPNQIFAVSLPFSPLSAHQQKSVVKAVQNELLTPYGLRTLNVQDSRYKGVYTGPQQQRDEAYHQGTVWAYLIGPFVESFLKVNGFSRKSRKKAAEFIQPLLQHLTEDGCLGSVSEIFDGDMPHKPRGCIAQAWSVAELIRAYQLINS